ncbi:hypothetical protein C8F01DRAFT_1138307 [Mycena amicta]|nr:hypothetical protein C8F01DRAFT_1138307 [Mycena amicta]
MALHHIPPEVLDIIIDHLHNDRAALLACGLVARNWVAGSRHHLFVQIYLILTPSKVSWLKPLVRSRQNTFSFHLRTLHLIGGETNSHQLISDVWPLLSSFPRLHTLHVLGNTPDRVSVPLMNIPGPPITSLSLSKMAFTSYRDLAAILTNYAPTLKRLTLHDVGSGAPRDLRRGWASQENLTSLEYFALDPSKSLLRWLQWANWGIRSAHLEVNAVAPDVVLWDYLREVGTQLTSLTLNFTQDQFSSFVQFPRLTHNTALRSLRIRSALQMRNETTIRPVAPVVRLLEHIFAAEIHLEELALGVVVHGDSPGTPLRDLIEVLERRTGLKALELFGPWDRVDDILAMQVFEVMSAALPALAESGIVRCVAHKKPACYR